MKYAFLSLISDIAVGDGEDLTDCKLGFSAPVIVCPPQYIESNDPKATYERVLKDIQNSKYPKKRHISYNIHGVSCKGNCKKCDYF